MNVDELNEKTSLLPCFIVSCEERSGGRRRYEESLEEENKMSSLQPMGISSI